MTSFASQLKTRLSTFHINNHLHHHHHLQNTDEQHSLNQLQRLIEKYSLLSHTTRSQLLQLCHNNLTSYFKQNNNTLKQPDNVALTLQLLLSLANVSARGEDYSEQNNNHHHHHLQPQPTTPLSWEDIVNEDPFQGDHWNSYSSDDEDEESDLDSSSVEYEDIPQTRREQTTRGGFKKTIAHPTTAASFEQTFNIPVSNTDPILVRLAQSQYYATSENVPDHGHAAFSVDDPNTLTPSLIHINNNNPHRPFELAPRVRYLLEIDLVREVIAALRGRPGWVFELNKKNELQLRPDAPALLHAGRKSVNSFCDTFLPAANAIRHLRAFIDSACQTPPAHIGPTPQALASSLHKYLETVELHLDKGELLCMRGRHWNSTQENSDETQEIPTLLEIREILHGQTEVVLFLDSVVQRTGMYDEIAQSPEPVENRAAEIASKLLSELFSALCEAGSCCDAFGTRLLEGLFRDASIPYLKSVADWIKEGRVIDESGNEFEFDGNGRELFIISDSSVSISAPDFWESGFRLRQRNSPSRPAKSKTARDVDVEVDEEVADENPVPVILPEFLDFVKEDIFRSGRNIAVLKLLLGGNDVGYDKALPQGHTDKLDRFDKNPLDPHFNWLQQVLGTCRTLETHPSEKKQRVLNKKHPASYAAHLPLLVYTETAPSISNGPENEILNSEAFDFVSGPSLYSFQSALRVSLAAMMSGMSSALAKTLLEREPWDLRKRLDAFGGIYLMSWGGVVDDFVDAAVENFTPPRSPTATTSITLTSMLNGALRAGGAGCIGAEREANEGFWRVEFDGHTLDAAREQEEKELQAVKMLWGLDIQYNLPHPLPSLLGPKVLKTYSVISRLLRQLRATRRSLNACSRVSALNFHQTQTRQCLNPPSSGSMFVPIQNRATRQMEMAFRFALSRFVVGWETYLLRDVCELERKNLNQRLDSVVDVMEIRTLIKRFAGAIKGKALLHSKAAPLLRLLLAVLDLSPLLSAALRRHTERTKRFEKENQEEPQEEENEEMKSARRKSEEILHAELEDLVRKLESRRRRAVESLASVGEQAGFTGLEALALSL